MGGMFAREEGEGGESPQAVGKGGRTEFEIGSVLTYMAYPSTPLLTDYH